MNRNDCEDWTFDVKNKYGDGLVVTATFNEGEDIEAFEIDSNDPNGDLNRMVVNNFPATVIDKAVRIFSSTINHRK